MTPIYAQYVLTMMMPKTQKHSVITFFTQNVLTHGLRTEKRHVLYAVARYAIAMTAMAQK
jgi:hypothetical protein